MTDSGELIARWRTGDQQAAAELFHRYADRLIALARCHLSSKLSQRVDPEDVVQSAYRSFFAGARNGRYALDRSGDLWRLLVAITLHKARRQIEVHTADKRSINLEQRLEDGVLGIPAAALAHEPSVVEAMALTETVEAVLCRLTPTERRVIELRLQGYSLAEIVAESERSRATVQRIIDRVKQYLMDARLLEDRF
jgi:RNA polymerase sigma factor (sigma-70 family)